MHFKMLRVAAPMVLAFGLSGFTTAAEWHVDPAAADNGTGDHESPFNSLSAARDAVREVRATREVPEPDTIWLRTGDYLLDSTFELAAEDSGTAEAPISWRAAEGATPTISGPEVAVLVAVYDVEFVHISGLHFKNSNDQAVELAHCQHVTLSSCNVENGRDTGVHLFGGRECEIRNCFVKHCGRVGIRVEAGDRETLVSAQHRISGCRLEGCGGGEFELTAAVHIVGVGNEVANCRVANCDDAGIRIDGNDHRIVENILQRTCLKAHDTGAIYLGHDWTERGNAIERNVISHVGEVSRLDAIGIYLDDFASGTLVQGNVISRAGRGIAVGGGSHNQIVDNVVEDCTVGIQLDSRGETWLATALHPESGFAHQGWSDLDGSREIYVEHYPELNDFDAERVARAHENQIAGNLLQRCNRVAVDSVRTAEKNQVTKNEFGQQLFVLRDQDRWELTLNVNFAGELHPEMNRRSQPVATNSEQLSAADRVD